MSREPENKADSYREMRRQSDQVQYWAHMLDEAMSDKTLNEAQDFDFLKKSINLDEFKINCTLYSIDIKDAVKALSFFAANGKFCIALDHFYWFDKNCNETDAPRRVSGDFCCFDCASLTSLEGSPQEVGEDFGCSDCTSLASLEGAPRRVGGDFYCNVCASLTSLEGSPQEVGRDFSCSRCTSLASLKGAPQRVSGSFICSYCTSLTSLEGSPQEVGEDFDCSRCTSLTSLKGAPLYIGKRFYALNIGLDDREVNEYLIEIGHLIKK